jgi:hypothetical protein
METVIYILGIATTAYEVASRIVPTSKTWSIIGLVLSGLTALSSKLDRKR